MNQKVDAAWTPDTTIQWSDLRLMCSDLVQFGRQVQHIGGVNMEAFKMNNHADEEGAAKVQGYSSSHDGNHC